MVRSLRLGMLETISGGDGNQPVLPMNLPRAFGPYDQFFPTRPGWDPIGHIVYGTGAPGDTGGAHFQPMPDKPLHDLFPMGPTGTPDGRVASAIENIAQVRTSDTTRWSIDGRPLPNGLPPEGANSPRSLFNGTNTVMGPDGPYEMRVQLNGNLELRTAHPLGPVPEAAPRPFTPSGTQLELPLGAPVEPSPGRLGLTAEPGGLRSVPGVAGGVLLGSGLAESLSRDGYLPSSVADAVGPLNHAVGSVLAPFSPTGGSVAQRITEETGSHTAGFLGGTLADAAPYAAASAIAGGPGMALVGAYAGLDYLANRSDFAVAGRNSSEALSNMGIDTSWGTFGHDLATEFRSGTSGLTTNVGETNQALTYFRQLYGTQQESGANLDLTTRNGYGAADAGARDRLLDLRDVSLGAARDPNTVGGAVFFPDGTSGQFADPQYARAMNELTTRYGQDPEYLGNFTRQEVLDMHANPGSLQTGPIGGYPTQSQQPDYSQYSELGPNNELDTAYREQQQQQQQQPDYSQYSQYSELGPNNELDTAYREQQQAAPEPTYEPPPEPTYEPPAEPAAEPTE